MSDKTQTHESLIQEMTVGELLTSHVQIGDALRSKKVVRSANTPTGDFAEYLFCTAFNWSQAPYSNAGYNAHGEDGCRYQIKGRRLDRHTTPSRLLSVIRDLDDRPFDILAAVLFGHYYDVLRAALIPLSVVKRKARYQRRVNGHILDLQDDVWEIEGVADVTSEIRRCLDPGYVAQKKAGSAFQQLVATLGEDEAKKVMTVFAKKNQ